MNQYVMLGRFTVDRPREHWRRPERAEIPHRITERTITIPGAQIDEVILTLGRFDVVIRAQAETNELAFDLASAIQEATMMTVETMPVATQHDPDLASPISGSDPAPVREPTPEGPPDRETAAHALSQPLR